MCLTLIDRLLLPPREKVPHQLSTIRMSPQTALQTWVSGFAISESLRQCSVGSQLQ
jgi:hypothetical protein